MPTNYTLNCQLNQWERTDKVLMEDFNADNAKIDTALAGKAEAAAVDSLAQTVSGHTSALTRKGNCRIWITSYRGSGQYGAENKNSITFPQYPAVAWIFGPDGRFLPLTTNMTSGLSQGTSGYIVSVSWSGSTVQWSSSQSVGAQLNEADKTYRVVALMDMS